jgi:hypothetical protein
MTDIEIDDATIAAAKRLFGVRYTDAERAQIALPRLKCSLV